MVRLFPSNFRITNILVLNLREIQQPRCFVKLTLLRLADGFAGVVYIEISIKLILYIIYIYTDQLRLQSRNKVAVK